MSDLQSRETRIKLKLIASLTIGDKVCTRFLVVQPDTYATKLSRYLYNENRLNTVVFTRNTILQSIELLRVCTDQAQKDILNSDLKQAQVGISNLQETYGDDIRIMAELSEIDETIKRIITP